MNKRIYQNLGVIGVALLILISSLSIVSAGSFTVSKSKSTVDPGGTFTVTVRAKSAAGQFQAIVSNGSGGSTFWLDNSSTTLKIKAGSSGTVKVTIKAIDVSDTSTEESVTGSKTVSVTIKQKSTTNNNNQTNNNNTTNNNNNNTTHNNNSNNNNTTTNQLKEEEKSKVNLLSTLSVDQGTLSPKFSENTTNYNVDVAADVNALTISAKAKDAKAKVSGTGKKSLEVGKNSFVIKCTAENGSVKSYTLNVNVDEKPLVYTEYNGKKLGIVRNLKDIAIPQSFEKTTAKIDDQEVTAYHSNLMEKTIIYLSDENNEKNFYLFEDNKVTSIFIPITILGRNVYQIDLKGDEIDIQNLTFGELNIDNNKLMGWIYNDPKYSQYSLIMVMNEQGKIVTYQYEKTEDSLQLYLIQEKQKEEKTTSVDENILRNIFIALSAILGITCVGLVIYIHNFKKKSISAIKEYYERRNQG